MGLTIQVKNDGGLAS